MKERYLSLDIFRGLTIALMILVNNSGFGDFTYAPLKHAKWHGFTPTDLVFPSFMFAVGVAMRFSFKPYNYQLTPELRGKIIKRTLLLFLISYLIFNFPYIDFQLSHLRILNVLQRIALAFCAVSFLTLKVDRKYLTYIGSGILLAYWAIMWFFGERGTEYDLMTNAARKFDLMVLGAGHLYHGEGIAFDPEGLLSTLPSIVTTLIGYLTGYYLQESKNERLTKVNKLIAYGFFLITIALIWNLAFPINKKLWTSSYVLLVGGIDLVVLAVLIWIIDMKGKTGWTKFFHIFGMNSIAAYGISELLAISLNKAKVREGDGIISLSDWIYWHVFKPTFGYYNGSLMFAITFVLVCWIFCWVMYKRKIFLKV